MARSKELEKLRTERFYENHPDYYHENKEGFDKAQKKWRGKNRKRINEYQKKWRERNPDYQHQWYLKKKEAKRLNAVRSTEESTEEIRSNTS